MKKKNAGRPIPQGKSRRKKSQGNGSTGARSAPNLAASRGQAVAAKASGSKWQRKFWKKAFRFLPGPAVLVVSIFGFFVFKEFQIDGDFDCKICGIREAEFAPQVGELAKSPVCGCMDEDIDRNGLLFMGKKLSIQRKGLLAQTNYLITAPSMSVVGPFVAFSFDVDFYLFKTEFPMVDFQQPSDFLRTRKVEPKQHMHLENIPYVSIVTTSPMNAWILGPKPVCAYMFGNNSLSTVAVRQGAYQFGTEELSIRDQYHATDDDSDYPRFDLLGDSVAFGWKGTYQLLAEPGMLSKIIPADSVDYFYSVLVVSAPFATRLSPLSWSIPQLRGWVEDGLRDHDFKHKVDSVWFLRDYPVLFFEGDSIVFEDIQYPAPNAIGDTGEVMMVCDELASDAEYFSAFQYFEKEQGFYYQDDDTGAFWQGRLHILDSIPELDTSKLWNLASNHFPRSGDAKENIAYSNEIKKITGQEMGLDAGLHRMKFGNGHSVYLRYPPLLPENSIILFNRVTRLRLVGGEGEISLDGKNYAVNRSDTLSFHDMKDVTFERPSISLPLGGQTTCVVVSGKARAFINGEQLGKKLFEIDEILVLALVTGLVGFLVMVIQIFRNK